MGVQDFTNHSIPHWPYTAAEPRHTHDHCNQTRSSFGCTFSHFEISGWISAIPTAEQLFSHQPAVMLALNLSEPFPVPINDQRDAKNSLLCSQIQPPPISTGLVRQYTKCHLPSLRPSLSPTFASFNQQHNSLQSPG